MELSIPYTLTGPDGTRVVFGNCDAAVADPDFVGFIDPDAGIVGLDGADVRENADVLVEQDGGIHGAFYEGRRAVVINLILDPRDTPLLGLLQFERKVKRAARALREDSVLSFTPSDLGIELALNLRRNAKVTSSGRITKVMQLPMVSADAAIRAADESSQLIDPAISNIIGYTSPYVSPYGTNNAAPGAGLVNNIGELDAIPRFVIVGPMSSPVIVNNSTGQRIATTAIVAAGETLEIDAGRKTVTLVDAGGNRFDRFGSVVYPDTNWWRLKPGSNDVRLLSGAYSSPATITIYWRPAYE